MFVIGFSVTCQTAQEHKHSLAWFEDLVGMKKALAMDAKFVLISLSKQLDDVAKITVSAKEKAVVDESCTIMDFPITQIMSPVARLYMFPPQAGTFKEPGARVLALEVSKKRKSSAEKNCCSCKVGTCENCKCGKAGNLCTSCSSANCQNT